MLGVELGEYGGCLGSADPLEYLVCLPQQGLGLRAVADGRGAAAQTSQCVGFVWCTGDSAGQFQRLLMTFLSRGGITGDPVQCPCLIEYFGLA
jgi:hypothetical protein